MKLFSCFISLRFLIKKIKAEGQEDAEEATETAAMPTAPVAKATTPRPSPQPDPSPSHRETSTTEVTNKSSEPRREIETHVAPTPAPATSVTLPVQQEEGPKSQDAVRPEIPPVGRGPPPEEDGEEAGPSGLNSRPPSSSSSSSSSSSAPSAPSAAPSAPFIPFSGGGQRLGGPRGSAVGRSLSSSSSSSAPITAVESPKAKKAKSSHVSSTKVSHLINEKNKKIIK